MKLDIMHILILISIASKTIIVMFSCLSKGYSMEESVFSET